MRWPKCWRRLQAITQGKSRRLKRDSLLIFGEKGFSSSAWKFWEHEVGLYIWGQREQTAKISGGPEGTEKWKIVICLNVTNYHTSFCSTLRPGKSRMPHFSTCKNNKKEKRIKPKQLWQGQGFSETAGCLSVLSMIQCIWDRRDIYQSNVGLLIYKMHTVFIVALSWTSENPIRNHPVNVSGGYLCSLK